MDQVVIEEQFTGVDNADDNTKCHNCPTAWDIPYYDVIFILNVSMFHGILTETINKETFIEIIRDKNLFHF